MARARVSSPRPKSPAARHANSAGVSRNAPASSWAASRASTVFWRAASSRRTVSRRTPGVTQRPVRGPPGTPLSRGPRSRARGRRRPLARPSRRLTIPLFQVHARTRRRTSHQQGHPALRHPPGATRQPERRTSHREHRPGGRPREEHRARLRAHGHAGCREHSGRTQAGGPQEQEVTTTGARISRELPPHSVTVVRRGIE